MFNIAGRRFAALRFTNEVLGLSKRAMSDQGVLFANGVKTPKPMPNLGEATPRKAIIVALNGAGAALGPTSGSLHRSTF